MCLNKKQNKATNKETSKQPTQQKRKLIFTWITSWSNPGFITSSIRSSVRTSAIQSRLKAAWVFPLWTRALLIIRPTARPRKKLKKSTMKRLQMPGLKLMKPSRSLMISNSIKRTPPLTNKKRHFKLRPRLLMKNFKNLLKTHPWSTKSNLILYKKIISLPLTAWAKTRKSQKILCRPSTAKSSFLWISGNKRNIKCSCKIFWLSWRNKLSSNRCKTSFWNTKKMSYRVTRPKSRSSSSIKKSRPSLSFRW